MQSGTSPGVVSCVVARSNTWPDSFLAATHEYGKKSCWKPDSESNGFAIERSRRSLSAGGSRGRRPSGFLVDRDDWIRSARPSPRAGQDAGPNLPLATRTDDAVVDRELIGWEQVVEIDRERGRVVVRNG